MREDSNGFSNVLIDLDSKVYCISIVCIGPRNCIHLRIAEIPVNLKSSLRTELGLCGIKLVRFFSFSLSLSLYIYTVFKIAEEHIWIARLLYNVCDTCDNEISLWILSIPESIVYCLTTSEKNKRMESKS